MNGHACLPSCGVQLIGNSCKNFHHSCQTKLFIQETIFNNAPVRRIDIAMNTNSAFTCTEIPFWYQHNNLRQIKILRSGQPNFDAADNFRLYVTTIKSMSFQDDIPSILFDDFKDHYVLVFDLTSRQPTKSCQ